MQEDVCKRLSVSEESASSCTVSAAEQKAGRKLRAGGWSVAEMLRPLLPARKCGRNAVRNAASAQVRQKCHQNCCQIMTPGQYEGIITPFEVTVM